MGMAPVTLVPLPPLLLKPGVLSLSPQALALGDSLT